MIYITGDTHGGFDRVEDFCKKVHTTKEDILIILGDVGFNYYGGSKDKRNKEYVSSLPITIFAIHGNHEQRPGTIESYKEKIWHGGTVYYEEAYPDLLFAKDGELFDLDGKKTIVIGGAYSVDRFIRIARRYGWWADEQPSDAIKAFVEKQLEQNNWTVDVVLSHTIPFHYQPVEVFLSCVDQSEVDDSTERWLGEIEEKLTYKKWYCGHFHTEKKIDKLEIMYENFDEFCAWVR